VLVPFARRYEGQHKRLIELADELHRAIMAWAVNGSGYRACLLTQEALQALVKRSLGADVNAFSRQNSPPSAAIGGRKRSRSIEKEKLQLQNRRSPLTHGKDKSGLAYHHGLPCEKGL